MEFDCGLPVRLTDANQLEFEGIPPVPVDKRRRRQMKEVLYETDADLPEVLYFMYRGLGYEEDVRRLSCHGIRYDITVIPYAELGQEHVKTKGHYHPTVNSKDITYPEVYEVIGGRAIYLLQRPGSRAGDIDDVVLVRARPGDKVVIPPNYGHITVNPGPGTLVMANLVAKGFDSIYEPIGERGGAAYYLLSDGSRVKNTNYARVPVPREVSPWGIKEWAESDLLNKAGNLSGELECLYSIVKAPDAISWLKEPQVIDWDEIDVL